VVAIARGVVVVVVVKMMVFGCLKMKTVHFEGTETEIVVVEMNEQHSKK
jgi:hypothetical protein